MKDKGRPLPTNRLKRFNSLRESCGTSRLEVCPDDSHVCWFPLSSGTVLTMKSSSKVNRRTSQSYRTTRPRRTPAKSLCRAGSDLRHVSWPRDGFAPYRGQIAVIENVAWRLFYWGYELFFRPWAETNDGTELRPDSSTVSWSGGGVPHDCRSSAELGVRTGNAQLRPRPTKASAFNLADEFCCPSDGVECQIILR